MKWWCAAQGGAWSWEWQPYLGVWAVVVLLIAWYVTAVLRPGRGGEPERRVRPVQMTRYGLGVLILWAALDWPLGALGAGYLLSLHTLQYILLVFVVPPLLITGTPQWALRRVLASPAAFRTARVLSRPLIAFAIFNVVMLATHLPEVVDQLTVSQIGSFAVNGAWFASGLVFWWPVLGPLPELQPLSYPGRLLYLVLNIFLPTVPASFMTFAQYPIYGLYELAPRVSGLSAAEDQQIAGILMKVLGGLIIFGTATVLFFTWWQSEGDDDADRSEPALGPAGALGAGGRHR